MPIIRDLSALKPGQELSFHQKTYRILSCIFHGPFSSVYKLMSLDGELFALKLESKEVIRPSLKMDAQVLKSVSLSEGFVRVKAAARNSDWKALIMQLVGPDLHRLQTLLPNGRFSLPTAYYILLQVLDRLESLHSAGYLHRDLKAANLAVDLDPEKRIVYLLDFGMCRRYLDEREQIILRNKGPVCGTIPFSSIASNRIEDTAPKDDLENWFFMGIHLIKGSLPWFISPEDGPHFGREALHLTREWKIWCMEVDRKRIFNGLPQLWQKIHETIRQAKRKEPAPIEEVRLLVKEIIKKEEIDIDEPLDWQRESNLRQLLLYSQEITMMQKTGEVRL